MKAILPLVLAVSAIVAPLMADVPPPRPSVFVINKIAGLTGYKFFYATGDENPPKNLTAVKDGQSYSAQATVRLFVKEGDGTAQPFAVLEHEYRGKEYTIEVRGVTRDGGKLKVDHLINSKNVPYQGNGPVRPPTKSSSTGTGAMPYFALACLSLGVFVAARPHRALRRRDRVED